MKGYVKQMKKIISALLLSGMMVSALASCQLSTLVPPASSDANTDDTTTSAPDTTAGAATKKDPVTYDYMGNDLTQFITLPEYKGIKIKDMRVTVTDAMVDKYIEELLIDADCYSKQRTGKIEEYMLVSMDYVGKINGEAFEGGSDKDFVFLVTENSNYISGYADRVSFIEGFASGMIGQDITKDFDINVTFPEDYGNDLGGKEAVFTITINHILKADELNATTLKKLSKEENITIDSFKKQTKDELVDAYEESAKESMNVSIWEILKKNTEFKALPDSFINEYYEEQYAEIESMSKVYGMSVKDILSYYGYSSEEKFKEMLTDNIKENIILYQIVKVENLIIDDTKYEERLTKLAEEIGDKVENIKKNYTKDYLLEYFYFEDVTDLLYTNAVLDTDNAN